MGARRWRLRWVTALLTTGSACLTATLLYLGPQSAGAPGPWFGWAAVGILLAGALGLAAGAHLGRGVRELRRGLLRRDPEAAAPRLPSLFITELQELAQAGDLLAGQVSFGTGRLEQQSAHLATLVESVSDGLLRIGPTGRIQFLNPAARALLDLPPAAEGMRIGVLVRSLEMRQLLERALQGERVPGTEIALGERRILVSAQPLPGSAGEGETGPSGAVVALSDLTAQRRLEGVRRDFVANVSHELKTPLTSIRGYAETLLGDQLSPELQRQFLEVIQRNAARLQRIVDELLDLSMIESGGWKPQVGEVMAAALINDVWGTLGETAIRRGITFTCPASELRVMADPGALRQVIGNLLDNAIRYSPDGGSIRVSIAPATAAGPGGAGVERVAIEVIDNGTGIPSDALPRIFERFYRVDPARSRAAGGTGLGLAIVKHMVEGMGGEVTARSELGKGTTIRFTLPTPAGRGATAAAPSSVQPDVLT